MTDRIARSVVMIGAGCVLVLFFWDLHVFWFQGGPIGLFVGSLALFDLWESRDGRSPVSTRGLLDELREEVLGPDKREGGGDSGEPPR